MNMQQINNFFFNLQARKGIKGFVRSSENKSPIAGATIVVDSREHVTKSHTSGDYFRILLPGNFESSSFSSSSSSKAQRLLKG